MRISSARMMIVSLAVCCLAASLAQAEPVRYERDIKPILKARCYACHGALKQAAGLRLDTGNLIRQGGDGGEAVVPEQPEESLLVERVSAEDAGDRMPPEGEPLTAAQLDLLRAWITEGAISPEGEQPEADPREHWAFQAPQRPALPAADGQTRHPIDAFIDAELVRQGLTPRPAAPKHLLLRRVYLDLIGLPPTREELQAFLADESPDAYEQVVDRLLKDERYGERWGRHWMDVWRYSDWYGRRDVNDVRNSASQIYRWRDWIVRSLNAGNGYDRMVREMLAADEIAPEDYEAGAATGYLIRNYYALNPNDWMRNAVEHTGKAFLGLTFNCAHCHDHKYDPIEHEDYFRMRAFFEPIFIRQDRVPGEADPGMFQDYNYSGIRNVQRLGVVRVFDRQPDAPTWFYTGGDERNRVKERGSIPPGVPAFLASESLRIEPVALPPRAWYPGLRPEIQETLRAEARAAIARTEAERDAIYKSDDTVPPAVLEQLALAEAQYAALMGPGSQPGALAGRHSLVLEATTGRRIVQNGLKQLKSFDQGALLSFQLQILADAHVNFQFVKDNVQGLTAGYVAFEKGGIRSYRAGEPAESEIGKYDFAAGQNRFELSFLMQPSEDRALLTIRCLADEKTLVEVVPIALNGWSPLGDPKKTVSFDARTGSIAVIDDVIWHAPLAENADPAAARERLLEFDFEPPKYADGSDALGIDGWAASTFSVAPALSVVSSSVGSPELREAGKKLTLARRLARTPQLRRQSADAALVAARAGLASLEARIAADLARHGESPGVDVPTLIRAASQHEREAAVKKSRAAVEAQDLALLDAMTNPAHEANRAAAMETAAQNLAAARQALETAAAALTDDTLADTYAPLSPMFPQQSTGRRRALAEWITRRDNPLTARVAVNHIWTRHFHAPLVASMYDFGRNGEKPTHPELLDWLAVEFMESGWEMKHLHRLIVTSAAYSRVSAVGDASQNVAADPENKFLWRMNASRMEAEVVRDSLLYVAGRLDLTPGGVELETKDALTTNRRSLYYSTYPEAGGKTALGELFDAPDPLDCYRRASSIVPQQALVLTNSDLVQQSSVAIVKTWQDSRPAAPETSPDETTREFISAMFEQILTRSPTEAEHGICREALAQQQQLIVPPDSAEAVTKSRESLVRILLNHNDFLTVR